MGVQSGGVQVEGLESLEELVGYLRNANPQVRALGAQVALAVTATEVCWLCVGGGMEGACGDGGIDGCVGVGIG